MVATINVLSGGVGGIAKYFTNVSDYYHTEETGLWYGCAADRLGLQGNVKRVDLELVLAGFAPNGRRLTRRPRLNRDTNESKARNAPKTETEGPKSSKETKQKERVSQVPGCDVTFSAPKSVSAAHALADERTRETIELCLTEAVRQTLDFAQDQLNLARRGLNGTEEIKADLLAATFLHRTSRELDPQLHMHCVIANAVFGEDGKWSKLNSRQLHNWTPALGRVFRCYLAASLKKRLGFELERPLREDGKREAWFEIKGVPKSVLDVFSRRRQAIVKATPAAQLHDAKARELANKATRPAKQPNHDWRELQKGWRMRAAKLGLTQKHIERLMRRSNRPKKLTQEQLRRTVEESIQELGREKAHFRPWQIVSEVCERLQHRGVDPATVVPKVFEMLRESRSVVRLQNSRKQKLFSTRENWDREKQLLQDVDTLENKRGAVVPLSTINKVCSRFHEDPKKHFSAEQSKIVRELLGDEKSIRILTGVAGAGKSVTLDAIREALERQGYKVIGGALAGTAAAGLHEKTKMPTRTVASYLYHLEKSVPRRILDRAKHDTRMLIRAARGKRTYQMTRVKIPRGGVLIIDEAGMLDTKSLGRLIKRVKQARATLILVGDSEQLSPIEAGGPLERIAKKLGYSHLATSYRQLDADDRKAADALRRGKVKEALDNYVKRGRLTLTKDHDETIDRIVDTWKSQGGLKKPSEHIVLTQTRKDAAEINRRCQEARLGRKRLPGLSIRNGETTYYRGDRVMFHLPMRKFGIENGFSGTVTRVDPLRRTMTVKLDNTPSRPRYGKKGKPSQSKIVTIPLLHLDDAAISLGYAATTHKLQGATVDHALVMVGGKMLSQQLAYTQLTRARKTTQLFATRDEAGKNLENLAKAMSRSSKKDIAHDVGQEDKTRTRDHRRHRPDQSLEI